MNNKSWSRGKGGSTSGGHVDHLLSAYIQKDLDPATRSEVLKHLQSCAECRAGYIELEATRRLLKSLPAVAPTRAFTITPEMAGSRAREQSERGTIWSRLFARRNAPRFAFGSVVSVVLMLIVLGVGLVNSTSFSGGAAASEAPVVAMQQSQYQGEQDNARANPTAAALSSSGANPETKMAAAPTTAAASGGASAPGPAAQSTATPAAGALSTELPQAVSGTPVPGANYSVQSSGQGSPRTASSDAHSSLSAPAPGETATPSSSLASLAVSFGVLLGLVSVLLAVAALISTRRAG